ncbi:MAG: hypothetical protein FJ254_06665 [Phycisphaerae bacterium]|nr:hypothetical protein [Phycisphaerae bacterium]
MRMGALFIPMIRRMHSSFRERTNDGVTFLECSPLRDAGFVHAFSTRRSGESAEPFDSLDLQRPGAAPERRDELERNTRRFLDAIGLVGRGLADAQQVHGKLVLEPSAMGLCGAGDALIAESGGPAIGVRSADCVTLLVGDPTTGRAAAIHAGWRGVVAGVVAATIRTLTDRGSRTDQLIAAVGPAICAARFEVGPEVVTAFVAAGLGECARPTAGAKAFADLEKAVCLQAAREGLVTSSVHACGCCTAGEPARFFSHRRDAGLTGRMLSVIAPRH